MEIFTLDRSYFKIDVIDNFTSCIWTERYYGDGEAELVVPLTIKMIQKLPVGRLLIANESNIPMIIETRNTEDGKLKCNAISLLSWLNNRFVRTSAVHEDRYWYLETFCPGRLIWEMVYYMCIEGSPYLNGIVDIGIDNPERLAIPGLVLREHDTSGDPLKVGIPYGPLYDAMREIATTYDVGMEIALDPITSVDYLLGFRTYKGLDRTSDQTTNEIVRFSPEMDSFTNIKEIESAAKLKTLVYAFASTDNDELNLLKTEPGVADIRGLEYEGFDLRAMLVFADDITTDQVGSAANLLEVLNNRALDAVTDNQYVQAVDGEIVPDSQFVYGVHYNMGDIIEVQGNSGVIQKARVTEYIRSQDNAGEKAYPTVTMLG